MKAIKRRKSSRNHGKNMGTTGTGARKNKRGSGHKGGVGMAGTGKRCDSKKTLVQKMYGHGYFGKQGITSKKTVRDIGQRINVGELSSNLPKFAKKTKDGYAIVLPKYKILGSGDVTEKLVITCYEASKTAIEKVETAGGSVIVKERKAIVTPVVVNPKHAAKAAEKAGSKKKASKKKK
ncbi:MAG: uL15 family ribosomal protein [Nanoarchaeota archaeon]|jgi:large subunit ribosomal protein L15|nr:uL15 family ribosomal protein [Nanoarchaeota archaeon]